MMLFTEAWIGFTENLGSVWRGAGGGDVRSEFIENWKVGLRGVSQCRNLAKRC